MLHLIAVRRLVAALVATLGIVFGFAPSALALDGHPVEGKDYLIVHGPNKGSTYVRVAEKTNVNTPLFAEAMHTSPFDIRSDNPTKTLALCKRLGDGYEMGNGINTPEKRASNVVWQSCPEDRRYVYLVPGEILELTGVHHLSFDAEQEVLRDLRKCADASCVSASLKKLDVRVTLAAAAPSAQPAPAVTSAPQTAPAPSEPAPSVAEGAEPAQPVAQPDAARKIRELEERADVLGTRNVVFGLMALFLFVVCIVLARENRSTARELLSVRDNLKRVEAERSEFKQAKSLLERKLHAAHEEGDGLKAEFRRVFSQHERESAALKMQLDERGRDLEAARATLAERERELGKVSAAFDGLRDVQKRQNDDFRRCGELYRARAEHKPRLIKVDNELTELAQTHAALKEQYEELARARDPRADEFYNMIMRAEERIRALHVMRQELLAALPDESEFQELHQKLTAFRLDADAFYAEAQRDRNDAAQALGEAEAKLVLVNVHEERLNQRAAAFKELEDALQRKDDDLNMRGAIMRDREFQLRRLMGDLLEALGHDPNTLTLEEIAALDGASGSLHEARMRVDASRKELDQKDAEFRGAISDLQAVRDENAEAQKSILVLQTALENTRADAREQAERFAAERDAEIAALKSELAAAKAAVESKPVDTARGLSPGPDGQADMFRAAQEILLAKQATQEAHKRVTELEDRLRELAAELERERRSVRPAGVQAGSGVVRRPVAEEPPPEIEVRDASMSLSPDVVSDEELTRPRAPTLRPAPELAASPLYDANSRERGFIFSNLEQLVKPFDGAIFRVATVSELQLLRRLGLMQAAAYDTQGSDLQFQLWQLHDAAFADQVHVLRRAVAT